MENGKLKKSEMIRQLSKIVRNYNWNDNAEKLIKEILYHQERFGMLPPLVQPISAGDGDYFCPGNKWEPEDGKWFNNEKK